MPRWRLRGLRGSRRPPGRAGRPGGVRGSSRKASGTSSASALRTCTAESRRFNAHLEPSCVSAVAYRPGPSASHSRPGPIDQYERDAHRRGRYTCPRRQTVFCLYKHRQTGPDPISGARQGVRRRSDQAAVGGPAGELVAARELQLAQHRRHVGLDRLHRDPELAGDLLVRVAAGDEPQHLAFARRELVELGIGRRRRRPRRTRRARSPASRGENTASPSCDAPDRVDSSSGAIVFVT